MSLPFIVLIVMYKFLIYPFAFQVDKRNNGIWIWMPAQGYVSVPHQQDGAAADEGKPGKIMRYGK